MTDLSTHEFLMEIDAEYVSNLYNDNISLIKTDEIIIHSSGLLVSSFSTSITVSYNYTFLDLIEYLMEIHPIYAESSLYIANNKTYITIQNAVEKLTDYTQINKNGTHYINLVEIGIFTPKNDLLKVKNIIGIFKNNLENTINLYGLEPINLANLGTWNGFGSGPQIVPDEENNFIDNLLFIKYKIKDDYQYFAYNRFGLLKLFKSEKLLIPHLNIKINGTEFMNRVHFCLNDNISKFP